MALDKHTLAMRNSEEVELSVLLDLHDNADDPHAEKESKPFWGDSPVPFLEMGQELDNVEEHDEEKDCKSTDSPRSVVDRYLPGYTSQQKPGENFGSHASESQIQPIDVSFFVFPMPLIPA